MKPVAVIGAGAFGTALSIALSRPGRDVLLWGRHVEGMQDARENARYLPGIRFPDHLRVISNIREVPRSAVQILAVPAQQTGNVLSALGTDLPDAPLVLAAKGIDLQSGTLLTDTARAVRPDARLAVLSGPGFAAEIAQGLPTALTLAAEDEVLAAQLQERLSTTELRLYRSTDVIGVQLGGALKNIVAIACGIAAGAGLGESARAALMTRGFAEIARLGTAMGAEAQTFTGLSGLGDLSLTCGSTKSRNFAAGLAIGKGGKPGSGTVEGIASAMALGRLAAKHGVEMPVCAATARVLDGSLSIRAAMMGLLTRPLKEED